MVSQRLLRVCVAIPTYRRQPQLETLLRSLRALRVNEDRYRWDILVVDNDVEPSAASTVADFAALFERAPNYVHAPRPGLAEVRNAIIENAIDRYDLIAMIDDDEIPAEDWLHELLRVHIDSAVDSVIGPVAVELPAMAPAWLRRSQLLAKQFDPLRCRLDDGQLISQGSTANCLISTRFLKRTGLRFAGTFGLTGGEDTHFFRQLSSLGGRIAYARHARVTELALDSRLTLRYVLMSEFRKGNSWARSELQLGQSSRVKLALRATVQIFLEAALLPLRTVGSGVAGAAIALSNLARAFGKLMATTGQVFSGYARRSTRVEYPK